MSIARNRIVSVLHRYRPGATSHEAVADELMEIVRDAVARGFENAAEEFDGAPVLLGAGVALLLRQWAKDAREDKR